MLTTSGMTAIREAFVAGISKYKINGVDAADRLHASSTSSKIVFDIKATRTPTLSKVELLNAAGTALYVHDMDIEVQADMLLEISLLFTEV